MDLREKKTRRSINNAFLQLRANKALERITVKELTELAEISKATFYLHYRDIYDLSERLQNDLIADILRGISHPEYMVTNISEFVSELFLAFHAQQSLIDILFSGSQAYVLPNCIEEKLKAFIYKNLPDTEKNAKLNMRLTYQIQGGYYVYQKYYKEYGLDQVVAIVQEMSTNLQ